MTEVRCAAPSRDILGECPLWNAQEQSIYWVDIENRLLHTLHPETGETAESNFPERIGAFCFRSEGGLVVGLESGIYLRQGEQLHPLCVHDSGNGVRFNDGRCDSHGRFWLGTMDLNAQERLGGIHRLTGQLGCDRVVPGLGIPNGLAWAPDERTFYYADSMDRIIYACDFDADSATVHNRRIFVDLNNERGLPDGATVDHEGFLWSAQCNGWSLRRYAPDGSLDRVVPLPVQYPTSCCFGGPDLHTLYVTSAVWDIDSEGLRAQPMAGSLLAVDVGAKGLPDHWFAG